MASSPRGDASLCYVSSEHCYQKPGASWEKSEERESERQTAAVKEEPDTEQKVRTLQTRTEADGRHVAMSEFS